MAEARATMEFENPVYGRLKTKFQNRGINRVNTTARPVDDIDADVKISHHNVGKTLGAIADPYDKATYSPAGAETRMFDLVGAKAKEKVATQSTAEKLSRIKIEAYKKETPFPDGTYRYIYKRAAAIRSNAVYEAAKARETEKRRATEKKGGRRTLDVSKLFSKRYWSEMFSSLKNAKDNGEREVSLPKIRVNVIIGIVIAFCILIMLIYSFSQISQIKSEITSLDNTREALNDEIRDLKLELDAKNDVSMLEAKAEDLGMVKSNKVTTKYINLASGEHIEVVGDESNTEGEDSGAFSTMLSTVSSNLDNLFDYFN